MAQGDMKFMAKVITKVKLPPEYRFFTAPHPTVIAGTFVNDKPTYNTLGDFGILCAYPLHVYIASVHTHYTNMGIHQHRTFSVNIPSEGQLVEADYVGSVTGHKVDKSAVFDYEIGDLKTAPLITSCPVNFECELLHTLLIGRNEVFMGKVHAIYINSEYYDAKENRVDVDKVNPITLFMNGSYHSMGSKVGDCYQLGKQYTPK
ncbi:MAG: flavin reductase family protein [Promethearchaeota archaeon]|nr:MAG: flavin reductase family protein [Candidatus Lokiarchaeota archaeon]